MATTQRIEAFAPASCANLNCGFDILGFALETPGDTVIIQKAQHKNVIIKKITGDAGKLPLNPDKNTASVAVKYLLKKLNIKCGIEITIHKNMPLESGLGSSAASSVAAIYALNNLLELGLSKMELIQYAMMGETVASGEAHADNIAPSMLGGFILIRSYTPLDIIQLPTPKDLYYTIVHPNISINTKEARSILRHNVALKDVITQTANLGGLISGLYLNDYALIGRSLNDVIIEPVRALLMPYFNEVKDVALNSGALGFGISGSGPSLFTLNKSKDSALVVAERMINVFNKYRIKCMSYSAKINTTGAVS